MLIREIVSLVLFHIVIILKEKTLDNYERFFYVYAISETWKGIKISITRKTIILLLANHESTKSP